MHNTSITYYRRINNSREYPCTFGHGHPLGVGLVRTHDVRESLLLQKVRHGLVPEADRASAAEAVAVPGLAVHAVLLLLLGRRIRPDAIQRDLLIIVLLVLVRGGLSPRPCSRSVCP